MNLLLLPIMFLLTCGLFCRVAIGQESGAISGKVVSKRTEEIIVGATVSLVGENAKTLTDKKGRFRLEKLPLRPHTLAVRMIGYKDFSAEVALDNDKPEVALLVELEETDKEENEIEVIAYRENTQNSNFVLDAAYLQRLPGSVGDPVRALLLMPGIMPTNDFSSQLIVRGGGADQNLVLLENVEIFNPYRLFGTVSMFNPMTLKSINMWLGGFPARYGDRLSAVMDVTVREGTRSSAFSFTGDISIIDANLTAEGAISPLEGSWLVSLRRTYLDLLIGPALKISPIPNFTEGQFKVSLAPLANHRLEAFGFFSQDGTRRDVEERFSPTFRQTTFGQLSTQDYMLVATWKHFSSSGFGFLTSISTYRNKFNSSFDQKIGNLALGLGDTLLNYILYEQASALQKQSFLQRIYFSGAAHSIEAGFNVDWLDTQFGYERRDFFVVDSARAAQQTARFGTVRPASLNAAQRYFRLGIYVQDKIQWGALSLEPSLRFDYSDLIRKSFFSPRLSVRYALPDDYAITAAVGLFRQSPGIEKWIDQNPALLRLDFNDPTSILDLSDREALLRLQPESAAHYIAGIEKWFGVAWLFRFETYYKDFFDVIVQSARVEQVPEAVLQSGQDPLLASSYVVRMREKRVLSPTPVNDARGRAFGFEISLEKKQLSSSDPLSGLISYSFTRSERVRGEITVPFLYDRPHNLNFVLSYRPSREWEFSVSWRYASGLPYTPVLRAVPIVAFQNGAYRVLSRSNQEPFFMPDYGDESNLNSARLPDYHRLDLRVTYLRRWGDTNWQFYLDVLNLYNRENLIGFSQNVSGNRIVNVPQKMLPLLPSFGFNIQF